MHQVERATPAEIPSWLELADEVGGLFGVDMARDPGFLAMLERNVIRGSALCVKIEGRLAGAMLYRDGRLSWLAVRRAYRRQGVGRALVAYAIGAGAREVRVTTFGADHPHPDSQPARELYIAMGFVPSGEKPELMPDGTLREVFVWNP
jgi:ribosomal protein S18 acetylase RimI-like enzyme